MKTGTGEKAFVPLKFDPVSAEDTDLVMYR